MAWQETDFNAFYNCRARFSGGRRDRVFNYGLNFARFYTRVPFQHWRRKVNRLINLGYWSSGVNTLVVGAGFGYLMSAFLDEGLPMSRIWGVDDSPYIQANKATEIRQERPALANKILDINIVDNNSVSDIRTATGITRFNTVIDDGVATSIPALEQQEFFNKLDLLTQPAQRVIHFIEEDPSPPDPLPRLTPAQNAARLARWEAQRASKRALYDERSWIRQNLELWEGSRSQHIWIDEKTLRVIGGR